MTARAGIAVVGMGFEAAGVTDPGPRPRNEDRFVCREDGRFAVIDGMGGQGNGDVAAEIAAGVVATAEDPAAALREARAAIREAARDPRLRGMGAVATVLFVDRRRFRIAHLGDTRALRVGGGLVEQLTRDHTAAAAAAERGEVADVQGVTADLGASRNVPLHRVTGELAPGEWIVLCSDGVYGAFDPHPFSRRLADLHARNVAPLAAARELVSGALAANTRDNATVVIVRATPDRPPFRWAYALVAGAIAVAAGLWWASRSADPPRLPVAAPPAAPVAPAAAPITTPPPDPAPPSEPEPEPR